MYRDDALARLEAVTPGRGIDRYRATLPVKTPILSLGEGDTPLLRSRRLADLLRLDDLRFKHEGLNPSGAFKDRLAALAVTLAREAGSRSLLSASSGNLGAALAAYCAAAALPCTILLEPGAPAAKIRQTVAAGAYVVPVAGLFAQPPEAIAALTGEVAARLDAYHAFAWAPVNPYILEASKTIAYEVVAQGGVPDVVVVPVGGGDTLAAQWRGYQELHVAGIIEGLPRLVGIQALGAAPLLQAFESGSEHVPMLADVRSSISGINIPFSGAHALAAVRASGGHVAAVSDGEIRAMQARLLREEGVWAEPVGAATVAALPALLQEGRVASHERVVCVLTGAGFKDEVLAAARAHAVSARRSVPFSPAAIIEALQGADPPPADASLD
ncbi:MAG: threonine synthase [Candidatus Promineifilaceae bacterium]|nr:threonine synthase [Candidatus Promineifilaceae bacterium]